MATLLEQSIEWQKKQIAILESQQVQYDDAANALSPKYAAARRRLKSLEAGINPDAPGLKVPAATSIQIRFEYDDISGQYFTARDQASANQTKLTALQEALNFNLSKVTDPIYNQSTATGSPTNGGGATTGAGDGSDPVVNRNTQQQADTASGTLPAGQTAYGTIPPSSGTDPAQEAFLAANADPAQDPTVFSPANIVPADLTPSQQAFLEANQADSGTIQSQRTPSIEEQAFLDANIDSTGETIQIQKTVSGIQSPAYDDDGKLMPGWSLDENNNPVWIGDNPDGTIYVEPATALSALDTRQGLLAAKTKAQESASNRDQRNAFLKEDWRVRLQLAPGAKYFYKGDSPGILAPLKTTDGVLFPYTPQVQINYAAHYDSQDVVHSNYKIYQYRSSSVDQVMITCDFTAQSTIEANYLLAVIHFFRSITKMFYAKDQNPTAGTPPPLCYLTGFGAYQLDEHPVAITGFNYSLPANVDYIRSTNYSTAPSGVNQSGNGESKQTSQNLVAARLAGSQLDPGGNKSPATFPTTGNGTQIPTYVPTMMNIQISAIPIITRGDVSNKFSLKDYASGALLRGSTRAAGGIW